jgi:hypothetical protein
MEGGHHQQLKIELADGNRREATCCLNLDRLNSIITIAESKVMAVSLMEG